MSDDLVRAIVPAVVAETDRLKAELERLTALKTPASRQLLNITKAALDEANAENAELLAALKEIVASWPGTAERSRAVGAARPLIAKVEGK